MMSASACAAGKLFLAGEYAVVETGRQALLVAVDRFVTVQVQDLQINAPVGSRGQLDSVFYGARNAKWSLADAGVQAAALRVAEDMAFAVVSLVDEYLRECGLPRATYTLSIHSELANADGRKYGLGSSAAVSVACVKALNAALALNLDEQTQLKLAMWASWQQNPNGSGGDVAASLLGGWVHYASPDRHWVREQYRHLGLSKTLALDWPGLLAQRLPAPHQLQLLVGWTGSPASTTALVAMQRAAISNELLDASDAAVQSLVDAILQDDAIAAMHALRLARKAVNQIAAARGKTIETAALQALCSEAEAHGAVAKTSGAGGGDCGIALLPGHLDSNAIYQSWQARGITPLDLSVADDSKNCTHNSTKES